MKSTRIVIAVLSILVAILGGIASNRLQVYLKGYEDWIWIPFVVLAAVFIFLELHEKQQERSGTRSDDLASRNRRAMIEKVRAIWITGVLNRSLYKETLITLGLSERPDAVERPMDILVQRPDKADQPLPPGTRVVDVYDELGGSLLILGAPGSGKTTLLLELTRDLLERAEEDESYPIPVVFTLSTWAEQRLPLADWLVDELSKRYDVQRKIGQAWVEDDQVFPLLDGLNEVKAEHRAACVEAINTFRQDHGLLSMVICSRVADYEAIGKQLRLQGAIIVQPLTREQVGFYLRRGGEDLAAVRQALRDDPTFWELLDTPLMLNIVTLAYAGQPVAALDMYGTLEERRRHVFAAYVERMFKRRRSVTHYTAQQTVHWLAWLAGQMIHHSQTVFYIEWLRPDWLLKQIQQRLIRTGMRIVIVLCVGLPAGLLFGLVVGLGGAEPIESGKVWRWLGYGLVYGLVVGLYLVLKHGLDGRERIDPGEILRWSWSKARHWLVFSLVLGLVFGLVVGLYVGLIYGLVVWLGSGLIDVLLTGLTTDTITTRTIPNEGMRRALRNALYSMLLVGLGNWLVFGLFAGLVLGLVVGLKSGLGIGLLFGLGSGLRNGGLNCIQHLLIRLMLVRKDLAPWRYADFLDYAAERILLRKVGGGYMFIHQYLLEYFASLDDESKAEVGSKS